MCGGTGGVPTASADAEPVAWLYTHPGAKPLLRHSRFPMSVPGWTETPLYTEAQMQARADAARREALDRIAALEAKLAEKDALLREYRATAFAAGKAARGREIVEWLREDHGDWSAAARKFADAIEQGEV